jgi:hypothetical protein
MAEPRRDELTEALAVQLRALGDWLETPEPPDVRAAVRARLAQDATVRAERRHPMPWRPGSWLADLWSARLSGSVSWRRRWVAVAVAIAVAVTVAVLPPSRAAVAHAVTGLLRFAGVEVHRGQPARPPGPTGPSGAVSTSPAPLPSTWSATLDEARRRARFPIGVPARLGVPDDVLLADPAPDGAPRVVSLLYRGGAIRLDEFDGQLDPGFEKSAVGPATEWSQVRQHPALWLPDAHTLVYIDRAGVRHEETGRSAGPTLIWTDGTVSYRLEGESPRDEAVAIATSIG